MGKTEHVTLMGEIRIFFTKSATTTTTITTKSWSVNVNVRDLLGDRSKHKRNNGFKTVVKGIVWECLGWLCLCRDSDNLTHR